MFIDTHTHYNDPKFNADCEQVLQKVQESGVEAVINCACCPESCRDILKMTKKYPFVYAAMGYHPHDVGRLNDDALDLLYDVIYNDKVVAIGEVGLDYHYDFSPRDVQRDWFIEQIELAKEAELPLIVHSRDAVQDTYQILKDNKANMAGGVIHGFSGSVEVARMYLELGFYIGLGGFVTFDNAKKLQAALPHIPLERILLETDCPYLTPVPNRGKRNDSSNLVHIAGRIADVKGISLEEVARQTTANARALFGIKAK